MAFGIVKLVCGLAAFASIVHGDAIAKRESMPLAKRQGACDPGETLCGTIGRTSYCAAAGNKCCSIFYSAPEEATCCSLGTYALPGNYCCLGSGSCPIGETCFACTPDDGSSGTTAEAPSSLTSSTSLTTPPPAVTTTISRASFQYYTFTITYYYYQFYWVYVPSLTRSTSTSSEVTTTTTVTVYASDSAEAQSSVEEITATASYPTPQSATELPPLPSSTLSSAIESTITSRQTTSPASASSDVTEFTGGANSHSRVGTAFHGSLGTYFVTFGVITGALCILL